MTLPDQLRQMRLAAGLSPEQASRAIQRPRETVEFYELGIREPSISTLRRLARVYGFRLVIQFEEDK